MTGTVIRPALYYLEGQVRATDGSIHYFWPGAAGGEGIKKLGDSATFTSVTEDGAPNRIRTIS